MPKTVTRVEGAPGWVRPLSKWGFGGCPGSAGQSGFARASIRQLLPSNQRPVALFSQGFPTQNTFHKTNDDPLASDTSFLLSPSCGGLSLPRGELNIRRFFFYQNWVVPPSYRVRDEHLKLLQFPKRAPLRPCDFISTEHEQLPWCAAETWSPSQPSHLAIQRCHAGDLRIQMSRGFCICHLFVSG